jgi:hypothetical protein
MTFLLHSSSDMPDIIGITESLLTKLVPVVQILLPSYHPPLLEDCSKDGIVLYMRESLSVTLLY